MRTRKAVLLPSSDSQIARVRDLVELARELVKLAKEGLELAKLTRSKRSDARAKLISKSRS